MVDLMERDPVSGEHRGAADRCGGCDPEGPASVGPEDRRNRLTRRSDPQEPL
jgi:hypothetical protein